MTTAMKRHKERKMMVRANAALADRVAELEAENTRLQESWRHTLRARDTATAANVRAREIIEAVRTAADSGAAPLVPFVASLRAENTRLLECGKALQSSRDKAIAENARLEAAAINLRLERDRLDGENTRLRATLEDVAAGFDYAAKSAAKYTSGREKVELAHWNAGRESAYSAAAVVLRRKLAPASDNATFRQLAEFPACEGECPSCDGQPCRDCGGSGRVGDAPCAGCGGHGRKRRPALRSGALQLPEGAP